MLIYLFIFSIFYLSEGLNSPQKTQNLARNNHKLVPYFAKNYVKKYYLKHEERREIIQYGYQGFMRACQKYDETKGAKLSTYSRFWIKKYMDDYIKDKMKNDKMICLDNNVLNILKQKEEESFLEKYKLEYWEKDLLIRKFLKNETFKSIAQSLKINRNTLRNIYSRIYEKIRMQEKLNN
jgi:RNA polymerase sigma factor (sigma-70 family)